jgi:hypothetical protein
MSNPNRVVASRRSVSAVRPAYREAISGHGKPAAGRPVALNRLAPLAVGPALLERSLRHGGAPRGVPGC